MQRMIIDCDPGHDDVIAIILAHRHADVLGITTVTGNAPIQATTRNALAVIALIGAETPIHVGAARPLEGEPKHAPHVHGASGLDGVELPRHDAVPAGTNAVDFILETTAAEDDVWLVAIGPLTNVALALREDPSLAERVAGISLMGGSTTVGNATRVAEFNIWADPEAADVVFRCGAKLVMCGLNLTHQLRTSDALTDRLEAVASPRARFGSQVFGFLHERMEDLTGLREAALHDPCAVMAVTHPDLFRTEPRAVGIELTGDLTRGMTVVDQRTTRRRDPANVQVAYGLEADAAMGLVMDALTES